MAFTRAQASALLNKTEMRLFDDSRANTLRGLDRSELDSRITRARASRDRARDLLKRQRGAARKTGAAGRDGVAARTARKEALLVEVLERFTGARRDAPAPAKKATAKKAAAKKSAAGGTTTKKTAAKNSATKKAAATKAPAKKKATEKVAAKKAATRKTGSKKAATKNAATDAPATKSATGSTTKKAAKKATRTAATKKGTKKAGASRGRLTPERALEQTRQLLEAKQERDRSPQPWQSLDPSVGHLPQPGFQSPEAASKAKDLHDGEARVPSIHGSISTRDRINQGKRDNRGGND